nr:hypothetical protein [Pandoravirus massiliensis]
MKKRTCHGCHWIAYPPRADAAKKSRRATACVRFDRCSKKKINESDVSDRFFLTTTTTKQHQSKHRATKDQKKRSTPGRVEEEARCKPHRLLAGCVCWSSWCVRVCVRVCACPFAMCWTHRPEKKGAVGDSLVGLVL